MMLGDLTIGDLIQNNWGWIAAGMSATVGALGIMLRTIWAFIAAELTKLRERAEKKAAKEYVLLDTLTEHLPQQTETLKVMQATLTESRTKDSEIFRQMNSCKEAGGELSYSLEALATDANRKEVERYANRARQKLGIVPEAKPGT